MNPEEKKRLYSPLTEMMEDESQLTSRPPAYMPLQQSPPNNQSNTPIQNPPINITTAVPTGNPLADPIILNAPQVGPKPMVVTCPHCRARSKTTIRYCSTAKTHIACLLLSWTLCCCCLPYCINSCRNANHHCSMCDTYIGTYAS